MTDKEIIGYINDGANYYVSLFGKAEHMNCKEIIEEIKLLDMPMWWWDLQSFKKVY
jgi:hypothetical protein